MGTEALAPPEEDRSGASGRAGRSPRSGGEPGLRQRRKAETRLRLLAAARRLFVERGYHATRPQDIARAAGVAVGTFYLHFADKSDVFLAFTDEAASELMRAVGARAAPGEDRGPTGSSDSLRSFEARLRASLEALLQYADEHPGVLRVAFADESVIAAARGPRLRDRLARRLARGLREGMHRGAIHHDVDPLLVAYAIVGLIQEALAFGASRRVSRAALLDQITRFCARALVPGAEAREEPSS